MKFSALASKASPYLVVLLIGFIAGSYSGISLVTSLVELIGRGNTDFSKLNGSSQMDFEVKRFASPDKTTDLPPLVLTTTPGPCKCDCARSSGRLIVVKHSAKNQTHPNHGVVSGNGKHVETHGTTPKPRHTNKVHSPKENPTTPRPHIKNVKVINVNSTNKGSNAVGPSPKVTPRPALKVLENPEFHSMPQNSTKAPNKIESTDKGTTLNMDHVTKNISVPPTVLNIHDENNWASVENASNVTTALTVTNSSQTEGNGVHAKNQTTIARGNTPNSNQTISGIEDETKKMSSQFERDQTGTTTPRPLTMTTVLPRSNAYGIEPTTESTKTVEIPKPATDAPIETSTSKPPLTKAMDESTTTALPEQTSGPMTKKTPLTQIPSLVNRLHHTEIRGNRKRFNKGPHSTVG